jgi:hypothetical protein
MKIMTRINIMSVPNFDPKLWGGHFWLVTHLSSLRYPENPTESDKRHFFAFYKNLQYILPCDGCCKGFQIILEQTKFGDKDLKNRDRLFAWTVKAHDMVNAKTGKPTGTHWKVWKQRYMKLAG